METLKNETTSFKKNLVTKNIKIPTRGLEKNYHFQNQYFLDNSLYFPHNSPPNNFINTLEKRLYNYYNKHNTNLSVSPQQ